MKFLIIGENCLVKLTSFNKSIFSTFSFISSIYARQIGAITPKKHSVKIVESHDDIDFFEECDVVHIHFKTATSKIAYEVADVFRKNKKTVILSGSHPSALPEEAKNHADAVIIGSTENLWLDVINDLEKHNLKSFYKIEKKIEQRLFKLPQIKASKEKRLIGIIEATKGCPYQCDFCQESNATDGSIFRTRPIKDVISEIELIPQKLLFFCDVSMTIDVSYTKELFNKMRNLKKRFVCEGNSDVLSQDEELLKLSYDAGCIEWTVGFESFSQQTLDGVHKKTNKIEEFSLVVKNIHKYKMAILGNFIFGFEQDTPEVFRITQENILDLGLDSARFAILTPYPGTPLYKKLEDEGRILTKDWSKYNRKNVVFKPKNMTAEELQNGFLEISSNFNTLSNLIRRDFNSLKLGFYPFLATIGRNLESYLNRPRKLYSINSKVKY